jgi:hypothetical protein
MHQHAETARETRPRATDDARRAGRAGRTAATAAEGPSGAAVQRLRAAPRVQALEAIQRRANAGPHAEGLARARAEGRAGPRALPIAPARAGGGDPAQLVGFGELLRSGAQGLGGALGGGLGWRAGAWLGAGFGPLGAFGGGVLGALAGGLAGYWGADAVLPENEVAAMERSVRGLRGQREPRTGKQGWADARLAGLDAVEHDAYAWLDRNREAPDAELYRRVRTVMDQAQALHVQTVRVVHQNDLSLWTPDRDTLGGTEEGRLDTAWDALRNSTGLIHTPEGSGGGRADDELRAMHARLLSRGHGRRLLYTLLDMQNNDVRGKNVDIEFTPPDTRSPQQKREVDELRRKLAQVQGKMELEDEKSDEYDELNFQQMNLLGRIEDLGGESDAAAASAVSKVDASIGGTGLGSDARVKVREGTRDSTDTVKDADGNTIAAPAFIQYAHELIHALHFRNAQDRTAEQFEEYHGGIWTNREEHQTIAGLNFGDLSENLLRGEHGLTARHGH